MGRQSRNKNSMGKQYNRVQKRRRRESYLKRKKETKKTVAKV